MPIAEVEQLSGDEIERWKYHFSRIPFHWELIDFAQAQICRFIAGTMGGKAKPIRKYLLINQQKRKQSPEQIMAAMRGALGG
jgi:hypothetical protein